MQENHALQKTQDSTVYYDKNAQLFYERTINIDFNELYESKIFVRRPWVLGMRGGGSFNLTADGRL